jgi:hypothetical protein
MNENQDRADIEARYEALKEEHRALDQEISGGDLGPIRDQLALSRMKRRKLALKDEIERLYDLLHPDIIA